MSKAESKPKIISLDLVRALSAIGIIAFHFSCHLSEESFKPFLDLNGVGWGGCIVTIFFVLSGALLYFNHNIINSLPIFYYKRWKSIFPMFYILFLYYFINNVCATGQFFYKGKPLTIIYSILGMDGYFLYRGDNYSIIGEWFLGAIIMLYIMYPVILFLVKKSDILLLALMIALFIWQVNTDIFEVQSFRNIISCLISFVVGVVMMKREIITKHINKSVIIAVIVALFGIFVEIQYDIRVHIVGMSFFIILTWIGQWIMKISLLNKLITRISFLSYAIFLLQHKVVIKVLTGTMPVDTVKVIIVMVVTIILTIIYAEVLQAVTNAVLSSKLFAWFEKKFVFKRNLE